MIAKVISLNVGKPIEVPFRNKKVDTGIFKKPTQKNLWLSSVNFDGDGQGDLVHHGGKEKAVCVYPYEHYSFWNKELERTLDYGAFGENLTIQGIMESDVHIGDIFKLGEAIVQVSQPRQPCYKLSLKYNHAKLPMKVQETGFTGFYFRVMQEGMVSPLDDLLRIQIDRKSITVAQANRLMHDDKADSVSIRNILEVEALSINWRNTFMKRLEGIDTNSNHRLTGDNGGD